MKLNQLIFSCMLLGCLKNYNIDLIDTLFNYSKHVRTEAAARVAQEEARIYAAKIAAEERRIAKETADGIVAIAKLIYKTGLFSYGLIKSPNDTINLLKNGNKDAWLGCAGLSCSIVGLLIAYKNHRDNQIRQEAIRKYQEDQRNLEEARQTQSKPSAPQYEHASMYANLN